MDLNYLFASIASGSRHVCHSERRGPSHRRPRRRIFQRRLHFGGEFLEHVLDFGKWEIWTCRSHSSRHRAFMLIKIHVKHICFFCERYYTLISYVIWDIYEKLQFRVVLFTLELRIMKFLTLLIVLSYVVKSFGQNCWIEGECTGSAMKSVNKKDRRDCLEECQQTGGCEWFTWYNDGFCALFDKNCTSSIDTSCSGFWCQSGERDCSGKLATGCWYKKGF